MHSSQIETCGSSASIRTFPRVQTVFLPSSHISSPIHNCLTHLCQYFYLVHLHPTRRFIHLFDYITTTHCAPNRQASHAPTLHSWERKHQRRNPHSSVLLVSGRASPPPPHQLWIGPWICVLWFPSNKASLISNNMHVWYHALLAWMWNPMSQFGLIVFRRIVLIVLRMPEAVESNHGRSTTSSLNNGSTRTMKKYDPNQIYPLACRKGLRMYLRWMAGYY